MHRLRSMLGLRSKGYGNALCVLPHDGVSRNTVTGHRFENHLKDAGFRTEVELNQGLGAAKSQVHRVNSGAFPLNAMHGGAAAEALAG
jgi:hypothetical protein